MRFDIAAAAAAALAATCAADRVEVYTKCNAVGAGCDSSEAWFFTRTAKFRVNANEGCRGTNVPHMVQLCFDWRRNRAHFRFSGQTKRCLDRKETVGRMSYWEEVLCHWKRDGSEENDPDLEHSASAESPETLVEEGFEIAEGN